MKIGVMVESFRKGFREGVAEAAALGAAGIQAYATAYGTLNVDTITKDKLREALDIVHSHGMVFSAICGDFGVGFTGKKYSLCRQVQTGAGIGKGIGMRCGHHPHRYRASRRM